MFSGFVGGRPGARVPSTSGPSRRAIKKKGVGVDACAAACQKLAERDETCRTLIKVNFRPETNQKMFRVKLEHAPNQPTHQQSQDLHEPKIEN